MNRKDIVPHFVDIFKSQFEVQVLAHPLATTVTISTHGVAYNGATKTSVSAMILNDLQKKLVIIHQNLPQD